MKMAMLAGVCVVAGTAHAEISVRTLDLGTTFRMFMSHDARVVVSGWQRTINFVRHDFALNSLGLPYTYPTYATRPSGDGNAFPMSTSPPTITFGWVYEGNPVVPVQVPARADECGDMPSFSDSPFLSFDGSVGAYNLIYIGDNLCGYQASGGRSRGVVWDRKSGATRVFQPTDFPGVLPGVDASRMITAVARVSDDGETVLGGFAPLYGGAGSLIFRYARSSDSLSYPFDIPGTYSYASLMCASADCATIIATLVTGTGSGATSTVVRSTGTDPLVPLEMNPPWPNVGSLEVLDVSNAGLLAVGHARAINSDPRRAVVWDADGQAHLLDDILLPSNPIGLCGWKFVTVHSVSPDASTIIGEARNHLNQPVAFMARLSGPPLDPVGLRVAGDTNNDAHVDGADLSALLSSFGTTVTPGATPDLNCDGLINAADLSVLLGAFGT